MARPGLINALPILRINTEGATLDGNAEGPQDGEIFLPARLLPPHSRPGDLLKVFIYTDGNGKLAASAEPPLVLLHEIACLRVAATNSAGAFLHWGLPKDLLLPWPEVPTRQKERVIPGGKVMVRMFLDSERRLAATARLGLQDSGHPYQQGDPVSFVVIARTTLGYRVAVDHQYNALIHHSDVFKPLYPGSRGTGYVKPLRDDGLLSVGIGTTGVQKIRDASEVVLARLQQAGGTLMLGDHSPAELVYQQLGISKKAFKQAIGSLYKAQKILITDKGISLTGKS